MNAPLHPGTPLTARRQVRFPLHPHRDESFQGFATRTAAWNFLDNSETLLKEASAGLGPVPRPGHTRPSEPHLDALSFCLGAPRADIERMLHPATNDGSAYVSYFGTIIRLARLDPTRRRVSPASLRAAAYHRANWAIRTLPFCAESWEVLVSQCVACGGKLGWRRTCGVDFCEHCGLDLKTIEPTRVPMELRDELGVLAGLLSPLEEARECARQQFTANVSRLQPGLIFELAIAFGRVATSPPGGEANNGWRFGLPEMTTGLCLLRDYSRELPKLLDANGENARRSRFFIRLASLEALGDPELLTVLNEITDELEPIRHGPRRLKKLREEQELMTLGQAARRLSIDNAALRTLIEAGALPQATTRGGLRLHQWLKPEDVEHLRERLHDRLSAVAFSRHFGLPLTGVRQLVAMGLVLKIDDPAVSLTHLGLQLSRSSALAFVDDLQSKLAAHPTDGRSMPLSDLFQGIGRQEKPWAAVLHAALAGELPGGLAWDSAAPLKIAALSISTEVAQDILRGARPDLLHVPTGPTVSDDGRTLSRQEVETYLNCFPRDVSWLISAGHLRSTSPEQGFPREAVEALGRELITTREINWRWRLAPEIRDALTSACGIRRAAGPFWPRDAIEEHFTRHELAGAPSEEELGNVA